MRSVRITAITAAIGMLGGAALAQTVGEESATTSLTVDEAIDVALEAQPGKIGEAELDQFEGRPAYDIEVVNEAGEEIEFKVDAETGEILNVWTDDDPTDDPASGSAEESES